MIDVKRKELLCPLCKSIGNTILPHTPPHIASASLPQTVTPTTTAVAVEGGLMDLSTLLSTNHESFSEALLIHVRSLLAAPKSAMGVEGESSVLESSDSTSSPEVPTVEVTTSASALYNSSFRKAIMRNFLPRWHLDSTMERLLGLAVPDLGRCIHLSWSAAAYTLLSASRAKFWLDSDCAEAVRGCGVLSPVVDEKEVSLVYQLLLLLRSVPPSMGGTDFNLEEGIITPLSNLLAGVQTTSTASIFRRKDGRREEKSCVLTDYPTDDDIRSAVLSQPLLCVGSLAFPDVKRQSMILAQSFRSAISPTERWPFMLTPLLEHDLHTIAIAFAAATGSVEKALEALSLLSLARLAQILIEPAATGVAAANSSLAADLLKADTGCFGTHKKEGGQDIEVVLTPPRVMVIDPHVCYDIVDIEMDSMQIAADRVRGIDVSDSDSNFGGSSRKREREGWPREGIKDAVITTGSIHSSTAALCEQLAQLRDMLYLSCGYTISATSTSGSERAAEQRVTPPVGRELLAGVVDSWIPFLEFCCSLRVVLLSGLGVDDVVIGRQAGVKVVHIDAAYEQLHCDMTHLTYLLQTLRVIVPPPLSTASLPVADESTLLSSLPHDDVTSHLQTLMGSPGLSSMFDAWGSQLAANTTTPNQSDSATESWVPEPALGTKAPAKIAESTLTIGEVCTNGKVEGATCETISSLIESPAHTEEVAIDEEDEHLDDIAHFDEDGDDDDDDDEDENYEDDDDFADSEEEGDAELGFFQQQIAGFLAEQPDDENLFNGGAEMGGVMAAVMQHLGMEPDEVLPANLAAIFQNIQVRVPR